MAKCLHSNNMFLGVELFRVSQTSGGSDFHICTQFVGSKQVVKYVWTRLCNEVHRWQTNTFFDKKTRNWLFEISNKKVEISLCSYGFHIEYILHDPLSYFAVPVGYYEITFTEHTRFKLGEFLKGSSVEQAVMLLWFAFTGKSVSCTTNRNVSASRMLPSDRFSASCGYPAYVPAARRKYNVGTELRQNWSSCLNCAVVQFIVLFRGDIRQWLFILTLLQVKNGVLVMYCRYHIFFTSLLESVNETSCFTVMWLSFSVLALWYKFSFRRISAYFILRISNVMMKDGWNVLL